MSIFATGAAPVKTAKAPLQIVRHIRRGILEGSLKPGDRLPVEQELMACFGVSRQTLREALRVLEVQGLVKIRAGLGGGAFVAEVDTATARESLVNFLFSKNLSIEHLSAARKLLDPHFAVMAAEGMSGQELTELEGILKASRAALDNGELLEARRLEIAFHARIAAHSGNPLLTMLHDFIESTLSRVKGLTRPNLDFSRKVLERHERIFAALAARDAEGARRAMLEDIAMVEEALGRACRANTALDWA